LNYARLLKKPAANRWFSIIDYELV
jgi:hypothetical protein